MKTCEKKKKIPTLQRNTRNATPRLSSSTRKCPTQTKSPPKQRMITMSFTLATDNIKCTCDNHRFPSGHLSDGDLRHNDGDLRPISQIIFEIYRPSRKPFADVTV